MTGRFRRWYGAGPLHLTAHLAGFAVAAFAADRILSAGHLKDLIVWYLGLLVAHDLVFVPLYTGLDRLLGSALSRLPRRRPAAVPLINHLRAPAMISAVLLIIYAPLISGQADAYYVGLTGHHLEHYLRNWLLLSAGLFLGSGAIYLGRVLHASRRHAG